MVFIPDMAPCGLVTLLTDFGWQDGYVGTLKGVILSYQSRLQVVDLTHGIAPQAIAPASLVLAQSVPYFPRGTVHLAVVDPGVGSQRRAIALAIELGWLVGPDNGLFSRIVEQFPVQSAIVLNRPAYWRTPDPSPTFHGRDIFAAIAAQLAMGVPMETLGETIDPASLVQLPAPRYGREVGGEAGSTTEAWVGEVQGVDHFGNLTTTIPARVLVGWPGWGVQVAGRSVPAALTYSGVPQGELVALLGSGGWLEIAVNGGSAAERLGPVGEVRVEKGEAG